MKKTRVYRLSDRLKDYTNEDLRNYAKDLQLKGLSHAKHDELAEAVSAELCRRGVIEKRLQTLSDFQIGILKNYVKGTQIINSLSTLLSIEQLTRLELLGFINKGEAIKVPAEVEQLLNKDDENAWHIQREKNAWLLGCETAIISLYMAAPIEILAKLAHRSPLFHESALDIAKQYMQIPEDLRNCTVEDRMIIWRTYPCSDAEWKEILTELTRMQNGKDFYIPSRKEIQELNDEGYFKSNPAYKKMFTALNEHGLMPFEADKAIRDIISDIQSGARMQEIMDNLAELNIFEEGEDPLAEFASIIMEMNNNTRMCVHRGHTPIEMRQKDIKKNAKLKGDSYLSANSSAGAASMQANLETLKALGFDVDTEEQASFMNVGGRMQKVYPNDPCPCGSGKLFKDCHGNGNLKS